MCGPRLTFLDFLLDQPDLEDYSESAHNEKGVRIAAKERSARQKELEQAYEWAYRAREIAKGLPPGEDIDFKPVSFDPEDRDRGLAVVFTQGTTIGTKKRGVLLVPERTRKILNELRIPFHTPDAP